MSRSYPMFFFCYTADILRHWRETGFSEEYRYITGASSSAGEDYRYVTGALFGAGFGAGFGARMAQTLVQSWRRTGARLAQKIDIRITFAVNIGAELAV